MSADRPLTDAQERLLVEMADHVTVDGSYLWLRDGRRLRTAFKLRELGLAENHRSGSSSWRPTAAGRERLASIGD